MIEAEKGKFSVFFITLNYFTIPQIKYLESFFSGNNKVKSILIRDYNVGYNVQFSAFSLYKPFRVFPTYTDSLVYFSKYLNRIKRYTSVTAALIKFFFSGDKKLLYIIDYQLLWIVWLFKLVGGRKLKVIYHEFEVVAPSDKTFIQKALALLYAKCVNAADLILIPEINRINFFFRNTNLTDKKKVLLFPNSCPVKAHVTATSSLPGELVIGHVGNAGAEHHIDIFLKAAKKFENDVRLKLLFVGHQSKETQQVFSKYNLKNCTVLKQVKHEELDSVYAKIDIGLILYKDIDLNFRYCAPNKLYEYWSYGIPVLAGDLPGLRDVFSYSNVGGRLIDFEDQHAIEQAIEEFINNSTCFNRRQIKKYFDEHLSITPYLKQLDLILS